MSASLLLAVAAAANAQTSLPQWKLGASPQVTIGGDGSQRTEFLNVSAMWQAANGDIVVVNSGTSEARVFDARGRYLRSFGRKGAGPGEFDYIGWATHIADTAIFYDGTARRITKVLLAERPRIVGEVMMTFAEGREVWVKGRLNDGRWMLQGLAMPDPRAEGLYRIPGYIGVISSRGTGATKWLADLGDGSTFVYNPSGTERGLSLKIAAFPAALESVATGSVVWFGDGASDSLVRIDMKTGVRKAVKLPVGASVTKQMVAEAHARELGEARTPLKRDEIEKRYSEKFLPKRLPTFSGLVAGPRSEVWVERGSASRAAPTEYVVLSGMGTTIARVATPAGFRVMDIGESYVMGVHRDEDGVETLRRYSLSGR
jgi:hypothetical protein